MKRTAVAIFALLAAPGTTGAVDGVCDSAWCPTHGKVSCSHTHDSAPSGPSPEELQRMEEERRQEEERLRREAEAAQLNQDGLAAHRIRGWRAAIAAFEKAVALHDLEEYRKNLDAARKAEREEIASRERMRKGLGSVSDDLKKTAQNPSVDFDGRGGSVSPAAVPLELRDAGGGPQPVAADPCAGKRTTASHDDTSVVDLRPDTAGDPCAKPALPGSVGSAVDLRGAKTATVDASRLKAPGSASPVLPMPPDAEELFAAWEVVPPRPRAGDAKPLGELSDEYYLAYAAAFRKPGASTKTAAEEKYETYHERLQQAMRQDLLDQAERERKVADLAELERLSQAVDVAFGKHQESLARAFAAARSKTQPEMTAEIDVLSRKLKAGETLVERERTDPAFRRSVAEAMARVFRREQERLAAAERKAQADLAKEVTRILKAP